MTSPDYSPAENPDTEAFLDDQANKLGSYDAAWREWEAQTGKTRPGIASLSADALARASDTDNPYAGVEPVENPGRNTGENNAWNEPLPPGTVKKEFDMLPQSEKDRRIKAGRTGLALFQELETKQLAKRGK